MVTFDQALEEILWSKQRPLHIQDRIAEFESMSYAQSCEQLQKQFQFVVAEFAQRVLIDHANPITSSLALLSVIFDLGVHVGLRMNRAELEE